MTDDTPDNIVLNYLREFRADFDSMRKEVSDIKHDVHTIKKTMLMVQSDALRREETIAGMQVAIDRIKRRLDLTDA